MNTQYLFLCFLLTLVYQPNSLNAQWFSQANSAGDPVDDNLPSVGGSWNDLNNDGYPDLLITGFDQGQNNRLYLNQQDGSYITRSVTPFTQTPGNWGSVVGLTGDYDSDGDDDVMLCSYRDNTFQKLPLRLLINQGSPGYELIPDSNFITPIGSYDSGSWLDYDLDGDLDFHAGAANNSTDLFYRNEGNGSFLRLDTLSFLKFRSGFIVEIAWIDLDQDGDLDLYTANYTAPNANTFHKSMLMESGDPNYFVQVEIPGLTGEPGANIGYNWIDYDNDGDLDLYLNHYGGKDRFFRNEGGLNFTEILDQPMLNILVNTNFNVWGDFDNDGDLDLALAHQQAGSSKIKIYANANGNFSLLSNTEAGDIALANINSAQAAGVADHDNDGDLDLYITNTINTAIGAPNFLFENEIGDDQNWIKIKLNGTTSNRNGYGAEIYVTAVISGDTIRQMRHVSGGTTSHAFQDCTIQHFGLGEAKEVISMEVHWLNGNVDVCTELAVNQEFEVIEGMCFPTAVNEQSILPNEIKWLELFPNPGSNNLTCTLILPETTHLHWRIIDENGKQYLEDSSIFQAGQYHIPMQTKPLPAGWYVIEFWTDKGGHLSRRWVKI